ncbi:MAG: hypothetical protein N2109_05240 [Fimbriimonadales bacterium]|nr:hypothetical protein [Fimbriimonadales bacterium]
MRIEVALLATLAALLAAGCGGQNPAAAPSGRGEGNIPIGKIRSPLPAVVTATDANRTTFTLAVTSDGTVFAPTLEDGPTVLAAEDSEGTKVEMPLLLRGERRNLFQARIHPKQQGAVCESLRLFLTNSQPIFVGRTVPIKFEATGRRVEGLQPSVWVSGGVGSVEDGLRFVATRPGEGTLEAELLGVRASLPITVLAR